MRDRSHLASTEVALSRTQDGTYSFHRPQNRGELADYNARQADFASERPIHGDSLESIEYL